MDINVYTCIHVIIIQSLSFIDIYYNIIIIVYIQYKNFKFMVFMYNI